MFRNLFLAFVVVVSAMFAGVSYAADICVTASPYRGRVSNHNTNFNLGNIFVADGYNNYNGTSGFSHSRNFFDTRNVVLVRLGGQYVEGFAIERRVVNIIDEFTGRVRSVVLVRVRVDTLDFWTQSTTLYTNGFGRVVYVPVNTDNFLFEVNGRFFARTSGHYLEN